MDKSGKRKIYWLELKRKQEQIENVYIHSDLF